jgi:micrococcal nuclease
MQTISDYIFKAKVLRIDTNSVDLLFDKGFYTFQEETINFVDANNTPLRSATSSLSVPIVEENTYLFQSFKPISKSESTYNVKLYNRVIRNYYYKGLILRVLDGDTVKARIDTGFKTYIEMDVRLQGINAPEITGATKKEGEKSKLWLENKVLNKEVILETFKNSDQFDKYGRFLALMYEPDKFLPNNSVLSINNEMLKAKLAIVMV